MINPGNNPYNNCLFRAIPSNIDPRQYELQRNFDLNKISVLANWKPTFSLNTTSSSIGGHQRLFIKASATRSLQNFEKHS